MLLRILFTGMLIIPSFSYLPADENPDDFDPPDVRKNVFPFDSSQTASPSAPSPLASLEGEPSAFIHGCVNVITGQFCDSSTDLVVHHGTDPLCVERTFCGGTIDDGTLGISWYAKHLSHLTIKKSGTLEKVVTSYLHEDQGGILEFWQRLDSKKDNSAQLPLSYNCIRTGVTNTSRGCLSGQTNLKNQFLSWDTSSCMLYTGSPQYKEYIQTTGKKKNFYRLTFDTLKSGNWFFYEYTGQGSSDQLKTVSIVNKNDKSAGSLNFPFINRKIIKKELQYEITSQDGRWVRYKFQGAKTKNYILSRVERSDGPTEVYNYCFAHDSDLPGIRYITQKRLPDNRVLKAAYYDKYRQFVLGKRIKLEDYDPRYHRVRALWAHVNTDTILEPIYHFIYNIDIDRTVMNGLTYGFGSGSCDVYDALKHKTRYGFNRDHRLTEILKYSDDNSLYAIEKLCWGKDRTNDYTFLVARSFQSLNIPIFARAYKYDTSGNVLEDILYGNLTGQNTISLQLNADGSPIDNGSEKYTKNQTYTQEGFNLLLQETDGIQTTTYDYISGTNNISAKFLGTQTQIFRRWFYQYNDDAALTQEIVDDGNTKDPYDLGGVTERHITNYTQSTTYPVGFPLIIEKKCVDIATGNELLVHKVVNTYTNCAHISCQEHYDSDGNHSHTLFWKYNNMGNITEEVNALGDVTTRQYDANGNCIQEQGPNEDWHKEYVYDFMNRLVSEKEIHADGVNLVVSQRYDLAGNKIATVDAYGNETNFHYDAFNRLIKTEHPSIQDEMGQTVRPTQEIKYNAMSQVTSEIDSLGVEKKMSYTIRGQLIDTIYADGTSERNTYHLNGALKETKTRNGTVTRYTHDELERPVRTEIYSASNELLSATSIVYRGFHIAKEIDPMGGETTYEYYPDGKIKSKHKADYTIAYTYDTLGRIAVTTEHYNGTDAIIKKFQYDTLDRVIEESTEDASGSILLRKGYTFDRHGNMTEITNYHENGIHVVTTDYNSHGVPTTTTDGEGNKCVSAVRYDFRNALGQCVPYAESTDPLGNVTITIQDALGRTLKTIKKNSMGKVLQKQTNAYDAAGNLRSITDTIMTPGESDREVMSQLDYDTSRRLVSCYEAVGTPEQKHTQITYNQYGQKHELIKNDGTKLIHTYDALGRLQELTASDGTVHYVYTYDLNGNPLKVDDLIRNIATAKTFDSSGRMIQEMLGNGLSMNYQYDALGRTTQVNLPDQSGIGYRYQALFLEAIERLDATGNPLYTHRYDRYDQSGHLIAETLPGKSGRLNYQYDSVGKIKAIIGAAWKEEITRYDRVGNILDRSITDTQGKTTAHYNYDDLYQLSSEDGDFSHQYICDSLYNRHSKDGKLHRLNALHQLLDDGKNQYFYDHNGNLILKKNGEQESHYTYDALDRLATFSTGNQKVEYLYDDNNRRLAKTHYSQDALGEWAKLKTERYLYQGQNEIGCADEQGTIIELRVLGNGKGAEIGAAVAMELSGKLYTPIHDHCGNVACLLDGTTGEPVECYHYSAFGETITNEAMTPWRFSSKRFDEETGFIYFGRRYYDPDTGRWVTPDPIGREGGPNLYAYVLNRPLTHHDLYGLVGVGGQSENFIGGILESIGRLLVDMFTLPGKLIGFIGHDLIPVPYVKDAVEFGGWCLAGKNPAEYTPSWNRPGPKLIQHIGKGYTNPSDRHVLYCGMGTTEEGFRANMATYSSHHGNINVWGVYNGDKSLIQDFVEFQCQKFGIPTHTQTVAERATMAVVELMGEYKNSGTLIVEAHSKGCETVNNLSQGLRQMMKVRAIGPARILHKENFKEADNFINQLDIVPWADTIGVFKGLCQHNVHYLPTTGCPLRDHLYNSDNYERLRQYHGEKYVKTYGVAK
ncbi:MAG: RHS repeat-associated core domain-containing protein [Parachlamydiaceae bacterium]